MADVPAVDATPTDEASSKKYEAIELRVLDADAKAKENVNRETDQRYIIRWVAVGAGCLIILLMTCALYHMAHQVGAMAASKTPAALLIALFVAPITSMTALALALQVAAFRGYKDGDEGKGMSAASDGLKATGLLR